jgi:hypothetical protein
MYSTARGSAQRHIVSIPAIALSATLAVRTAWTIRSCRAIYGGDRVHQHLAIWTRIGGEIRCAYGSGLEHRIEDECDVCQVSELAFRVFGVKEIDGDVTVTWPVRRFPSRQPHYSPIRLLNEPLDDVASNDPERTDNDRLILRARMTTRQGELDRAGFRGDEGSPALCTPERAGLSGLCRPSAWRSPGCLCGPYPDSRTISAGLPIARPNSRSARP